MVGLRHDDGRFTIVFSGKYFTKGDLIETNDAQLKVVSVTRSKWYNMLLWYITGKRYNRVWEYEVVIVSASNFGNSDLPSTTTTPGIHSEVFTVIFNNHG